MKKRTTICLLSCLVAITAASTSVSVAWYARAAFLSVEEINVRLAGSSDLLIGTSKEKTSFKSTLEYDDLLKVDAFEPVTSINQEEWFMMGNKYPVFYESFNDRATTIVSTETNVYAEPYEKVTTDGYYSQELYLYAENDYYAMINVENTSFQANQFSNWNRAQKLAEEYGAKTAEEYYEDLNKIIDSIRFSVLVDTSSKYDYKLFDPVKNQETTKLGGLIDTHMVGIFDTAGFEELKCETLYGEVNDRNLISYYDEPQPEGIIGKHTWFNSGHDKTAKQINFEKSYENGLFIKEEEALSLAEYQALKQKVINRSATQEEIDSTLLIPVKTGVPSRIVLSIYFEGFDIDSIIETMSASFTCKITFDVVDYNII